MTGNTSHGHAVILVPNRDLVRVHAAVLEDRDRVPDAVDPEGDHDHEVEGRIDRENRTVEVDLENVLRDLQLHKDDRVLVLDQFQILELIGVRIHLVRLVLNL